MKEIDEGMEKSTITEEDFENMFFRADKLLLLGIYLSYLIFIAVAIGVLKGLQVVITKHCCKKSEKIDAHRNVPDGGDAIANSNGLLATSPQGNWQPQHFDSGERHALKGRSRNRRGHSGV